MNTPTPPAPLLIKVERLPKNLIRAEVRGFKVFAQLNRKDPSRTTLRLFEQYEKSRFTLSAEERQELLKQFNKIMEDLLSVKKEKEKERTGENFSFSRISRFLGDHRKEGEKKQPVAEGGEGEGAPEIFSEGESVNTEKPRKARNGEKNEGILRRTQSFFTMNALFEKLKPPVMDGRDLVALEKDFMIWLLKKGPVAPPMVALDRDGYISPNRKELALENLDDLSILEALPPRIKQRLMKIAEEWGICHQEEEDGEEFDPEVLRPIVFTPVPVLRDPAFLKGEKPIKLDNGEELSWLEYVDKLAAWKQGKDPRLKRIHKSKLLRHVYMKYSPHSLEIAPGGTGKTLFYIMSGHSIDKATPKSTLGFAKSPDEIFFGTVYESELPVAYDQLESQTSAQMARFMFNILEFGEAWVDSGAVRFKVTTRSSFAYLGNPKPDPEKGKGDLTWLFIHLSTNPALGRRFGWIFFEPSQDRMRAISKKLSQAEEEEWRSAFGILRAVEEYCLPKIRAVWRDPKVVEWINKTIEGYREAIESYTLNTQDSTLREFLLNHAEAQHRVRAIAFQLSLVDNLDRLALDAITVEELIECAEEYLPEVVNVNIESARAMVAAWGQMTQENALMWFGSLPEYLKHIVSAIVHFKRAHPELSAFKLNDIPYRDEGCEYLSKAVDRLKRWNRGKKTLEWLDNFGINVVENEDRFVVTLKDGAALPSFPVLGGLIPEEERLGVSKGAPKSESGESTVEEGVQQHSAVQQLKEGSPEDTPPLSKIKTSPTSPPGTMTSYPDPPRLKTSVEPKPETAKSSSSSSEWLSCPRCGQMFANERALESHFAANPLHQEGAQ